MKIYSLFSKSLNRYNLPFFADDDEAAIATVANMVTAQADPALMCALDDLQLECVGGFEPVPDEIGDAPVFETVDAPAVILDDLHKNLPLPPTITARLDKFYGGALNA